MWPRVLGNPFRSLGNKGGGSSAYLLRDIFTTALAAGAVNGTAAEPTGQTRTVTDTNSKLSITGGVANFATGGVGFGDPALYYPSLTLRLGQIYLASVFNNSASASSGYFGWFGNTAGAFSNALFFISGLIRWNSNPTIDAFTAATTYNIAIIQRTTGAWLFIKGGAFTNWTLIWISASNSGSFPGAMAGGIATIATADDIRVPNNLYIPQPLAYDTFTRANGALGSTETTGPDSQVLSALAWSFTVGIWTIATNKAIATPALGADVIVNGAFAADTDWTKGAGWAIAAGVAAGVTASSDLEQAVAPLTVGRWYQVVYTLSGFSAGTVQAVVGGIAFPTHAANATYTETGRAGTTAFKFTGAGFTGSLDDVSAKLLVTAELFSSVAVSTADVLADVAVTLSAALGGLQAGLVVNLDSAVTPLNFILCYLDGRGNCVLEECVAGTTTIKFTTAITYSAGAVLRVVRSGTGCRVFYNNAAVGGVQTMTANVNLNTGLFSTSALNSLDGFTIWPRGTGNEYATLDAY